MSFPLPNNILQSPHIAVKQIMKKVKMQQSGELVDSMERMGIKYKLNYGVSIPQLREIAAQFTPDNTLAFQLFQFDVREAKILASILFLPKKLSFSQLLQISNEVNMTELVEQYSRNVFSKVSKPMELINNFLTKGQQEYILAFRTLGWLCKFKTANIAEACELLKQNISLSKLVPQPFSFAMQSLSELGEPAYSEMLSLAENLCTSDNINMQEVGKEFIWMNK